MDHRTARATLFLGIITGIAVVLRLLAVWKLGESPANDELEYHAMAVNFVSGFGHSLNPGHFASFRSPAYPALLAIVYALSTINYQYVLVTQAVLQALMVAPIFFLARTITASLGVALLAALLFAFHTSFEIVSRLYAENLSIILMLPFLWGAYEALRRKDRWLLPTIITGLCAGGLGLTKPELSLLAPFTLVLCLFWRVTRGCWRRYAIMATVSMLMIGIWQLQNHETQKTDSGQDGLIVHALLDSTYYPAHTGTWWWTVSDMKKFEHELFQSRQYFHQHPDRTMLMDEMLEKIVEHPFGFMKLSFCRVLILWFSPPVGSSLLDRISPALRWAALIGKWVFVTLALGMLVRSLAWQPALLPFLAVALYWTGVYSLIISLRRYSYPLVAEECILAAWALWLLYSGWRRRKRERLERRAPV